MLELSLSGWFTGTCVGALSSQSRNVGVITAVLTLIKHSFLNSIRLFNFCSCRSNKVAEQAQSSFLHPFMNNCVNEACACASKRMRFIEQKRT